MKITISADFNGVLNV